MKRLFSLIIAFILVIPSGICGSASADLELVVGTDLHYISPRLTDNGEYFHRVLQTGDGKLTQYSEEITSAFLEEVMERKPDALILTGDLTFNGAIESHEDLAEKLRKVEQSGIPVLVLTGNHDLFNRNAARFSGNSFERINSASSLGFMEIYAEFGLDEAISRDEKTLSYVYQLDPSTRILILDFNSLGFPCNLPSSTLKWIEVQLIQAEQEGQTMLAAGHQNLFQHSMFKTGYVVSCSSQLQELFEKYGIRLFLSGHLHIQHYAEERGVTEIATSALCLSPCQYATLKIEDSHIIYKTVQVNVSKWASNQGLDDLNLADFQSYAASSFDQRSRSQAQAALSGFDLDEETKEKMVEYAAAVQRGVFSGNMQDIELYDPDGSLAELWSSVNNSHGHYLSTVLWESGKNFNFWNS